MSAKTHIIEALFNDRWDDATSTLNNPSVSLTEVQAAILAYNQSRTDGRTMSTANPANFFKDFIRNQSRANNNWPTSVLARGYTAVQTTAEGRCFEFVPLAAGQTVAFPLDTVPEPDATTARFSIESISIPLASRRLSRTDEPWLIQVIVRLRVLETHFSLVSHLGIIQLDHLQTNVKLSGSEIDALFLGVQEVPLQSRREVIVCCEAKGRRDDIIPNQLLGEVRAAFAMGIEQDIVVPIAAKTIRPSEIYILEFAPVSREQANTITALTVATSAVYTLVPPVPGIGQ